MAYVIKYVDISKKNVAWWSTKGVPEIVYANVAKLRVQIRDLVLSSSI